MWSVFCFFLVANSPPSTDNGLDLDSTIVERFLTMDTATTNAVNVAQSFSCRFLFELLYSRRRLSRVALLNSFIILLFVITSAGFRRRRRRRRGTRCRRMSCRTDTSSSPSFLRKALQVCHHSDLLLLTVASMLLRVTSRPWYSLGNTSRLLTRSKMHWR